MQWPGGAVFRRRRSDPPDAAFRDIACDRGHTEYPLSTAIAKNDRKSVTGIKSLLLRDLGCTLVEQWANEKEYTRYVLVESRPQHGVANYRVLARSA